MTTDITLLGTVQQHGNVVVNTATLSSDNWTNHQKKFSTYNATILPMAVEGMYELLRVMLTL